MKHWIIQREKEMEKKAGWINFMEYPQYDMDGSYFTPEPSKEEEDSITSISKRLMRRMMEIAWMYQ